MTNILNAQEAFAALQKGKTVLCRYAGNGSLHADKDFSTLDQMPATVFALPNYEFCIQVEMIELAGIAFSKPLALDEYEDGQDVFVINTYSPSIYVVNFKTAALVESINGGFVQRDAENAKLQLKAISNALGHELNDDVSITRLGKEPGKSKRKKGAEAKIKTDDEASLDGIIGPVTAQCPTSNDVEKRTLQEMSATPIKQNESISFDDIAAAAVGKAKEIDTETVQKNNERNLIVEDKDKYQEKLATLKQRVDESQTPTEVNAVVKYTNSWSAEQRAPLLQYMHKRLEVLQQSKAAEQPSLMVRIQNAPDLTTLDAIEIDVSSLDPIIQPEMMRYVRTRRLQLEQTASLIEEDLP
ncbi:hypothetical protein [Acinetobacter haemolyticus]|uniref:hypothetical protein n=1 Tax=Acinetobacter haemolyticus TaxID=29430 RepID=UPI003EF7758F